MQFNQSVNFKKVILIK